MRRGQAAGTDIRACSVQVVVLLIRKIIGRLSQYERQELARAFLQNDAGNPTYKGFKYMLQVVEQLHVSPALVSYVRTEVAGQLRGMPQGAIFNSWVEAHRAAPTLPGRQAADGQHRPAGASRRRLPGAGRQTLTRRVGANARLNPVESARTQC